MTDPQEEALWFVQLEGGAVRAFTLDELDEAYQAGTIDESTHVRLDGSTTWQALGAVLAGAHEPHATHEIAGAASPASDAPPFSAPPPPVAMELEGVDETVSFGASRKRAVFGGLAAVAVLGALGFTAMRVASSPSADATKVGAALPAPVALSQAEALAADAGPRFNDEQRRLLLEADKKREAEAAARRPARKESHAPSKPIKIGDPIKKGGSKFDPLNGAL